MLAQWATIRFARYIRPIRNMADVNVDEFQRLWGFQARAIHKPIPRTCPVIARVQPAHDTRLGKFDKIDCVFTTPCLNPQIALKRPGRSRFLMRDQMFNVKIGGQFAQHFTHCAHAHDQGHAQCTKLRTKIKKTFFGKFPLTTAII